MYIAIPDRESIQICIMLELGLCTIKTALYPADMTEWCLYALFQENDEKIDKYCKYQIRQTNSNYTTSLGGFMWAISTVITEKFTNTLPYRDPCSRHKNFGRNSICREWV